MHNDPIIVLRWWALLSAACMRALTDRNARRHHTAVQQETATMKKTILAIAVMTALSGCGTSVTLSRKAAISNGSAETEKEICGLILPDGFQGQFTYKTDKCDVGVNTLEKKDLR